MAHITDSVTGGAFSRRSVLMWLLTLNTAVFVGLRLVAITNVVADKGADVQDVISSLSLPALWPEAWHRPWSWLTYMVTQYDPAHLMFNMLWLAWFGMLMYRRCGNRALTVSYLSGGIAGGLLFMGWSAVASPSTSGLIGASAAVMSVAVAIAVIAPDMRVAIPFIGTARLKWVSAIMLAIAVVCYSGYHPGSDAAHAGGVAAGLVYGFAYRAFHSGKSRRRDGEHDAPTPVATPLPHHSTLTDTELLDMLLDKIRRSGYDSLSATERRTLDSLSRRLNNN